MGCSGCNTTNGLPKGCKNNGSCGTGGCEKLSVFDWLTNMNQPLGELQFDCVEVRFKNERKGFYRNTEKLSLMPGDVVAVETNPGHDIGVVSLVGELVRAQMKQKRVKDDERVAKIYRKANQKDLDTWQECRKKEHQMMIDARRIAKEMRLEMKISDVEIQGDGNKATFYYTSDTRVDFRQLIREYAAAFKIRIEMRQIGYRQEAAKLGGIGVCGRELCCSTWLTDFRSVSTSAARYQQLSINPQKIAGQCGKLKCCLNYELDSYLESLSQFPKTDTTVETKNGKADCVKIDVFKKEMWFTYRTSENNNWYKLTVEQVHDIIGQNKDGKKPESLEAISAVDEAKSLFQKDIIEENSLQRFEKPKKKRRKHKPRKNRPSNSNKPKNRPQKGPRKK